MTGRVVLAAGLIVASFGCVGINPDWEESAGGGETESLTPPAVDDTMDLVGSSSGSLGTGPVGTGSRDGGSSSSSSSSSSDSGAQPPPQDDPCWAEGRVTCEQGGVGICVDLRDDLLHCGACGAVCTFQDGKCEAGICVCPYKDMLVCNGVCVNIYDDPRACGSGCVDCIDRLGADARCEMGTCTLAPPSDDD